MNLHVQSETSRLRAVVLGLPYSPGPTPTLDQTFDSKSYESVLHGVYPVEEDMVKEMDAFLAVLKKYDVDVYRPAPVKNCNQVFSRDVGFVIDDKIIVSNIIPDRQEEIDAYEEIYRQIHYKQIYNLPESVHVEGGDVVLYKDYIFLGQYDFPDYRQVKTARTNRLALDYLKMIFPEKTIIPLNLLKSDTDPYQGILHLDCTFMPVGRDKAIIYRHGFMNPRDADHLIDIFGKENVFEITTEEMYFMNSNVFSISEDVVVTEEHFTRLNKHLREKWGMTVETVPYREISKMGGLLRCSTLPLRRD
ncbi:MAG TPA: amidinotransferase [Rikenellaceae bacterium]|nr:amidinotransferase [Bacteroidales bacterium]HAC40452.1 amidinotransferase [Rikenellaceae bacterium]